jgi:hypothetical protein
LQKARPTLAGPSALAIVLPRSRQGDGKVAGMPSGLLGGGLALGNQVSDAAWAQLLAPAGFSRFRRAAETPFNRVFELRP